MYEQKPSCLKIYSKVTRITLPRGIGYFALEHLATAKLHHLYFTCMSMDAQQPPKGWGADRVGNKFIFTESFSLLRYQGTLGIFDTREGYIFSFLFHEG